MTETEGPDAGDRRLALSTPTAVADAEQRIKDAEELEAKLNAIQENVPTRIFNVCGSAAGAGSGDFHQYRMIRRREQLRLKRIDEEYEKEKEAEGIREKLARQNAVEEARTLKKRAKRQKRKEKKKMMRTAGLKGEQAGGVRDPQGPKEIGDLEDRKDEAPQCVELD